MGGALQNLVGQVARAAAGIAGVATIASAASSAMESMAHAANALTAPIRALLSLDFGKLLEIPGSLVKAFVSLTDAALKLTTGLFELGAAAAPGGMEAFGHVLDYATTVLGKIAIPVFVALSTAVLTIVEHFSGPLQTASIAFAKWIGQYMIAAIDKTIEFLEEDLPNAIRSTIETVQGFGSALKKLWDWLAEAYAKINGPGAVDDLNKTKPQAAALEEYRQAMLAGDKAGMQRWAKQAGLGHVGAKGPERTEDMTFDTPIDRSRARKGSRDAATRNLDQLLADMAASFAKKANVGYSGVADIHKTIQQQAFGGSIQQRQLTEQEKSRGILEQIRDSVKQEGGGMQMALTD